MKRVFISVVFWLVTTPVLGDTVADIEPPQGYVRTDVKANSFAQYLRGLPVRKQGAIKLWNGSRLPINTYDSIAVLDVPLMFNEDLEQCADFTMRLWADYHFDSGTLDKLELFDFYGRAKPFSKSGKRYRDYLHWHMTYSNSYSIKLGALEVSSIDELRAGDMFVQNDSEEGIGHVSMVIDEAINAAGEKQFLVGYSFMPAQQFHIERAPNELGSSGWFTGEGYRHYAELQFGAFGNVALRRYE